MQGMASIRATEIAEQAAAHFAEVDRTGKPRLFVPGTAMAPNAIPQNNNIGYEYDSIDEAFPDVQPGLNPMGNMVLVMVRQPRLRTAGGIQILADARQTEFDNTQVGKVVSMGPLAFHSRDTYKLWPEGAWCQVGDFVRISKYQGDRFAVTYQRMDFEFDEKGKRREFLVTDRAVFVQFKDLALLGKYPTAEDALAAKAYL